MPSRWRLASSFGLCLLAVAAAANDARTIDISAILEADRALERSFLTSSDPDSVRRADQVLAGFAGVQAATPEAAALKAKDDAFKKFVQALAQNDEANIRSAGAVLWRLCGDEKPPLEPVLARYLPKARDGAPVTINPGAEKFAAFLSAAPGDLSFDGARSPADAPAPGSPGYVSPVRQELVNSLVPPINRDQPYGSKVIIAVNEQAGRKLQEWRGAHPGEVPSIDTLRAVNREAVDSIFGREGSRLYAATEQRIRAAAEAGNRELRNTAGDVLSWAPGFVGPAAQLALNDMTRTETNVAYGMLALSISVPGLNSAAKIFRSIARLGRAAPEVEAAVRQLPKFKEKIYQITTATGSLNSVWSRWGDYSLLAGRLGIRRVGNLVYYPAEVETFNLLVDGLKKEGCPCGFRFERYVGEIVPYPDFLNMLARKRAPIALEFEGHDIGFHMPGYIFSTDKVAEAFEGQAKALEAVSALKIADPHFQEYLAGAIRKTVDGADGFAVHAGEPRNYDVGRLVDNMRRAGIDRSGADVIDDILKNARLTPEQTAAVERIKASASARVMSADELKQEAEAIIQAKRAAYDGRS